MNKFLIFYFLILFIPINLLYATPDKNITFISNYYQSAQYTNALNYLEVLINKEPLNYEYRYQRAFCLYKLNKKVECKEILIGLLKDDWLPKKIAIECRLLLTKITDNNTEKKQIEKELENRPYTPPKPKKVLIQLEGSIGLVSGDVIDIEENAFGVGVTYQDGHTEEGKPYHYNWHYGINFKFNLSNYLGVQIGIQNEIIYQLTSVGGGNYESKSWGGQYINCYNPYIGGFLNFIAQPNFVWYIGLRIGYLNGTINPFVSAFNYFNLSSIQFDINGYNAGFETGIYGISNTTYVYGCAFAIYNNSFNTKEKIYTNIDNNFSIMTYDFYVFLGLKI